MTYRRVASTQQGSGRVAAGPYPDITPSLRIIAPNDPTGTAILAQESERKGVTDHKNVNKAENRIQVW